METLGSRQVYADPWISVRLDEIRRTNGSTGSYSVVDSSHVALVVPIDGDRLHLVEQYRYPVLARRWEFPAGTVDSAEDPAAAAVRELREETGLVAETVTRLGLLDAAPGTFSQRVTVFLASGLTSGEPERQPEEQDMRSAWLTRAEVERMMHDGSLVDAKSLAAYTLLLLRERTAT